MRDRFEIRWHGVDTGGSPALDLANTLDWRLREQPVELLHTYTDLLRWAWSAGVLELEEARTLRHWAESHARLAARALARAVELREAAAMLFHAKAREEALPRAPLTTLEGVHQAATKARVLRTDGRSVEWAWREPTPEIDRVSWAVALDAVRLLTTSEGERIRQCADAECGWFFLDVSRNRSRRWCSMEACGNRNKVRSFYRRSATARRRADPEVSESDAGPSTERS